MQNRNMFLYRRQGTKKRTKPGPQRKNRGQQKGLPNSARDLLPLIQPATKALAQMLAGRTGSSGQLGHARAVLAQTERLVSERAHNRLNPAEREEFFEQVARLKLTLADAESEAEVQSTEEDAAPVAAPTPVNRERLKEMAMALTAPGGPVSYEDRHKSAAVQPDETVKADEPLQQADDGEVDDQREEKTVAKQPDDPNQLRLPRAGTERVAIQPGIIRTRSNGRRRITKPDDSPPDKSAALVTVEPEAKAPESTNEKGRTKKPAVAASSESPSKQKLPKGWIIDDEGFVVPGPAC